jgi:hypothetical protein
MGAGRGRRRRVWVASGGRRGNFRLDALPRHSPPYAKYTEILHSRTHEGTEFRLYHVQEYARSGNTTAEKYGVVIEENETFWVTYACGLDMQSSQRNAPSVGGILLPHATYRSVRGYPGLPENQGQECVIYVVEHGKDKQGVRVPSRCGVRFLSDEDSYWIVPAVDLDLGPLAV